MEHPDITSALRTGCAALQCEENQDTPENRAEYIEDHMSELVNWLRLGYPEILDEFIEFSAQACRQSYKAWLN
jgi:hypothetical protein